MLVRAMVAARERGISLDGVTFDVRSEPLTEARRLDIESSGAAVLFLRVAPRVGAVYEPLVRATLLAGLDRGGAVDRHMAALWRRAGTIVIRREEPVATAAGKVLPFYRDRRASPSA